MVEPSKTVQSLNCVFQSGKKCDYEAIENAQFKMLSFQPINNDRQAWVRSPTVTGLGPYCLNVQYSIIVNEFSTSSFRMDIVDEKNKRKVIYDRSQSNIPNERRQLASKSISQILMSSCLDITRN